MSYYTQPCSLVQLAIRIILMVVFVDNSEGWMRGRECEVVYEIIDSYIFIPFSLTYFLLLWCWCLFAWNLRVLERENPTNSIDWISRAEQARHKPYISVCSSGGCFRRFLFIIQFDSHYNTYPLHSFIINLYIFILLLVIYVLWGVGLLWLILLVLARQGREKRVWKGNGGGGQNRDENLA